MACHGGFVTRLYICRRGNPRSWWIETSWERMRLAVDDSVFWGVVALVEEKSSCALGEEDFFPSFFVKVVVQAASDIDPQDRTKL